MFEKVDKQGLFIRRMTIFEKSDKQGKNSGRIFRFSVSGTPKTDRTTPAKPKRLSDDSLARQRVIGPLTAKLKKLANL
ncbi:hypothetical protein [Vibrio panuliri]|uniref:Uncharacterized protein n=1 Tax=Vibrio panuliri TaxID=1381081 RepID=A0ABX3FNW9_9VIBR|nr:hypothetical protein [Vibrio panuliri]KAB1457951.1 hypothetical protein F7O85_09540 [Vibrio panuliri]OLQ95650.1 hypothetical protein BIY20_06320 [Vibrio panuliri]